MERLSTNATWNVLESAQVTFTTGEYQVWTFLEQNNEKITYLNEWYNLEDNSLNDSDIRELEMISECPINYLVND
jgi:hypothetical protein